MKITMVHELVAFILMKRWVDKVMKLPHVSQALKISIILLCNLASRNLPERNNHKSIKCMYSNAPVASFLAGILWKQN